MLSAKSCCTVLFSIVLTYLYFDLINSLSYTLYIELPDSSDNCGFAIKTLKALLVSDMYFILCIKKSCSKSLLKIIEQLFMLHTKIHV